MVALLAYLPTTFFGEHFIYLLFFFFLAIRERRSIALDFYLTIGHKPVQMTTTAYLVVLILFFSLINNLINLGSLADFKDIVPYMLLMALTMYFSKFLTKRDALIILLLIVLETFVGIYEFTIGVNTIFTDMENFRDQSNSELLYFKRVFGLSLNSSALAEKILIGFFLLFGFHLYKKWWGKGILLILLVAVIITFSRTLISTGIVLAGIIYLNQLKHPLKSEWQWTAMLAGFLVFISLMVFVGIQYSEQIIAEFTRRQGSIEITGRGDIWSKFITFWLDHPLEGNGSYKLWLGKYHAHNSFLQTLASQGIVIFSMLMIVVLRNTNNKNYWIIIPVFFYSFTQYGIFWGVSLFDIVFFHFLLHHYEEEAVPVKLSSIRPSLA